MAHMRQSRPDSGERGERDREGGGGKEEGSGSLAAARLGEEAPTVGGRISTCQSKLGVQCAGQVNGRPDLKNFTPRLARSKTKTETVPCINF